MATTTSAFVVCPRCLGPYTADGCLWCGKHRRDDAGRFTFDGDFERLCRCGHKFGVHAAMAPHPCFNEDTGIEGATGELCACEKFKPRGKAKS